MKRFNFQYYDKLGQFQKVEMWGKDTDEVNYMIDLFIIKNPDIGIRLNTIEVYEIIASTI